MAVQYGNAVSILGGEKLRQQNLENHHILQAKPEF